MRIGQLSTPLRADTRRLRRELARAKLVLRRLDVDDEPGRRVIRDVVGSRRLPVLLPPTPRL